jgi:hypothetical protein
MNVEIHAPSQMVLLVSVVLALLAIIGGSFTVAYLSSWAFWLAILAYVVLALGALLKT